MRGYEPTLFIMYVIMIASHLNFMQVYQDNIYIDGVHFQSFHKLLHDMGPEFSDIQLVSFNSTSKGYFGE